MSFGDWIKAGMPHHWKAQNETNYKQERITPLLQYIFVDGAKIDFIGRVENFTTDMRQVIERLNTLCAVKQIPHRFSYGPSWQHQTRRAKGEYLTRETSAIVRQLLARDFEFGYDPELLVA